MVTKIRAYIKQAFEDVPQTKRSVELQEEIISNLVEKYNDQLRQGKNDEEAYQLVIASVGDLSELTEGLKERHTLASISPADRKKSATIKAIAVALYIISPMALIGFGTYGRGENGLIAMFVCIAVASALLVYNSNTRANYIKEEETMIEEFKEWKSKKHKKNEVYRSLQTAYWLIVVVIYLYLSFNFYYWHFTWIIFIIAAAIQQIVKALLVLGEKDEN